MRLTVLGCGPAAPQPDTPASGLLVQSGSTAILLDCGQGVAARLLGRLEPAALSAVVIGHMHADHFIDLAALRYSFPWGESSAERLPVLLPPGGLARFAQLAGVVSERPGFFDDAFDVHEYDPAVERRVGDLELSFVPGRHYVPAWGVALRATDGTRLVYAGDSGPNPDLVAAARGANLLVCEATLGSAADDDQARRGHLSLDEAIDHAQRAAAARLLVTHYPSARREAMSERLAKLGEWAALAHPDLVLEVGGGAPAARVRGQSAVPASA
ncbi:MAG: MBL fold metallo-hydrolase [Chloroflexota bacterium]|nr:MBL fold metallo-hydrolase [Chloroflexota bacterium]